MQRRTVDDLVAWSERARRKPLVIRGARQVGKTTLVRLFAERRLAGLAEIDFERHPDAASLFASKNPREILSLLEIHLGHRIVPGETLLFLDEIQAAPEVFASLRYFYEELPELHLIAAGSLLELVLEEPRFPVPVGRIEYLHLGPMDFEEFLVGVGHEGLARFLRDFHLGDEIPEAIHQQLLSWLWRFLVIGGMPDAVVAFAETGSYQESEAVKQSILATFRDDFGKYGAQADVGRLRKVFERLPQLVGERLKYVNVDREERSKDLAAALHLLTLARVATRVRHSSANQVPLGAEADERRSKLLCLDVGLMATASGLSLLDLEMSEDPMLVHRGSLCEQFVGQHLLYSGPSWEEPRLHFWQREKSGSAAEVDYVISQGRRIFPVEVKAGKTGTLKSLHVFVRQKGWDVAVRFNADRPSLVDAETALSAGPKTPFQLVSLPLYLVGQTRRILGEVVGRVEA